MKKYLILIFVGYFFQNCFAVAHGYNMGGGSLFTSVTLNKDVSTAIDTGSKTGEACTHGFLGLISVGDGSAKKASENGSVKVVKAVDYSYDNVLGLLYESTCTIVRGD